MKLYYYYDREADVLYFSQGKPSTKDIVRETDNDLMLRLDPKTRTIRGFTILNFSRRAQADIPICLPINAVLTPG